jgi:hypothetical protein
MKKSIRTETKRRPVTRLALILFMKDGRPGVPVGSATWNSERQTHHIHSFNRLSCPPCITDNDYLLIDLAVDHLNRWVRKGLPYPNGQLAPFEDEFWEIARDFLIHRVRLLIIPTDELVPDRIKDRVLH